MQYFFKSIIKPYILHNKYKYICEIGAESGGNTDKLSAIDQVKRLVVIDPCLKYDLVSKYKSNGKIEVIKDLSLNILPYMNDSFDCILIDGDHNWYTVYNELKIIHDKNLLRNGGTIFLHDVGWPYGLRDLYYIPESIPEKYRHNYSVKGMMRNVSELLNEGGFNKGANNACHEGGPKNGVRCAVEDILTEFGASYRYCFHDSEHGLGIIMKQQNFKLLKNISWYKLIVYCRYLEFFYRLRQLILSLYRSI